MYTPFQYLFMFCKHSYNPIILFISVTLCGNFSLCATLCTHGVLIPTLVISTTITVFWTSTTVVFASTTVESSVSSSVLAAISSAIASRMDVSLVVGSSTLSPAPHPYPHLRRYQPQPHYVHYLMGCTYLHQVQKVALPPSSWVALALY